MPIDRRKIAVATTGFCAFLNLYSPQALLPELAREFAASPAEMSSVMTASAAAIALTAPFTGALADVIGRKRVITAAMLAVVIPMGLIALSTSLESMIVWRFLQGLLLPPIFAVAIAYVGDEWPTAQIPAVAGLYVTGASIGGFAGRFVPGVLADLVGWQRVFGACRLSLAGASWSQPAAARAPSCARGSAPRSADAPASAHPHATYAIGFGVLSTLLRCSPCELPPAPPYSFSPTLPGTSS
jgi:MFS family permease